MGGHQPPMPLLRLADGILLCSIAATTVGAAVAAASGNQATPTTSKLAINVGALFIGREEREGDNGSGVGSEDDDDIDAEAGEYAHDFLDRTQPTLGGAFWQENDNGKDNGDE